MKSYVTAVSAVEALLRAHPEAKVFFLGICGAGMTPLAWLAAERGLAVFGADRAPASFPLPSGVTLCDEGEPLPQGLDLLVYTAAVPADHPHLREAERRGMLAVPRTVLLGALEKGFSRRVAVSGMHGKSSTVGMCAEILTAAGLSPTVLAGASLGDTGGYRAGKGDLLLYEACEYRDSFLALSPTHTVILNTEWEHTDYFADEEAVLASFRRFAEGRDTKAVLLPAASPLRDVPHAVTFGETGEYTARDYASLRGCYSFALYHREERLCRVSLSVLGRVQAENALAAAALCHSLGVSPAAIAEGLSRFRGIPRRMEYLGRVGEAPLYLDYAHHPTELSATLETARTVAARVVCVFEAHTYSRAYAFRARFASVLRQASAVGILPIFPARETDTLGISGEDMAKDADGVYLSDYREAAEFLCGHAERDSLLLLIGAGNVPRVVEYLGDRLKKEMS